MSKNILIDTCYWIALFRKNDTYHTDALVINECLSEHKVIIPWPSLYEYLNTEFLDNPYVFTKFKKIILLSNVIRLPDNEYRENALSTFFGSNNLNRRLSLVDLIIREMIADDKIKIHNLVTFNPKDFIDVCQKRNVEIFVG